MRRRDEILHRQRRDAVRTPLPEATTENQYCNTFSPWVNASFSTEHNETAEREIATRIMTDKFCPPTVNGQIRSVKCKDNKGEPFHDKYNETSGDKKYVFSCGYLSDSDSWGAVCDTIMANGTCPDYAIQLFCSCASTTGKLANCCMKPGRK